MDLSPLVGPLEPDDPYYDIIHDFDVVAGFRAFLAGERLHFDVELLAADQSHRLTVRVTPIDYRKNPDYPHTWLIEDGLCQRLTNDGQPEGPVGSCNGYFATVETPTVGKLDINIPS